MKKYLITFLVVCNLSAQSNFTVFAGFNRGDINSGSASVSIANVSIASTIEPLIGMRIGLETQARNWDFGSDVYTAEISRKNNRINTLLF